MKTMTTLTSNLGKVLTFAFMMMLLFGSDSVYAQSQDQASQESRTITGTISDESGPLENASIALKGSNQGTVTNKKGEFRFPIKLKTGDILLISYLGYETVEFRIKANTSVVKLVLTEDFLEFVGSVNTDKLYKSKRTKKRNKQ